METKKNQPTPQQGKNEITEKNVSDSVLARVNELQEATQLQLPKNYSAANALKSAWLVLQTVEDKDHHRALEICTKESIANCLFDMVIQGLSVVKKQCYFIVYGKNLTLQRSYFGTVALAKRVGAIKTEPVANIIYEGDEFVYEIDPKTGIYHVKKHVQTLESIGSGKIKAAYCICQTKNGDEVTIMTYEQIQKAWNQGATHGKSPAHTNFAAEMAKKTVIGRACKMAINSSDDSWILNDYEDEPNSDSTVREQRDANTQSGTQTVVDADYEELTPAAQSGAGNTISQPALENAKESTTNASHSDNDPY